MSTVVDPGSVGELPHHPLSRALVMRAALEIVDRDGVAGLSMRRLGAARERDPMSLCRYTANKAVLLDGVAKLVLEPGLGAGHVEAPQRRRFTITGVPVLVGAFWILCPKNPRRARPQWGINRPPPWRAFPPRDHTGRGGWRSWASVCHRVSVTAKVGHPVSTFAVQDGDMRRPGAPIPLAAAGVAWTVRGAARG